MSLPPPPTSKYLAPCTDHVPPNLQRLSGESAGDYLNRCYRAGGYKEVTVVSIEPYVADCENCGGEASVEWPPSQEDRPALRCASCKTHADVSTCRKAS